MYASPLNVSSVTATYFSVYKRDRIFGAQFDAHSHKWTGSVQINPEYESDHMIKALRWACASAHHATSPFLAVAVLPAWKSYPHTKMIHENKHRMFHILARIPARSFNFVKPITSPYDSDTSTHTTWPIYITLIGNQQGYHQFYQPQYLAHLQHALIAHSREVAPNTNTLIHCSQPTLPMPRHKPVRRHHTPTHFFQTPAMRPPTIRRHPTWLQAVLVVLQQPLSVFFQNIPPPSA